LIEHLKCFASRFAWFLAERDIFPLLKLWHSQFPQLTNHYPSQQWLSFCIHRFHTAAACWDERRRNMAPSRGPTNLLYHITVPLCSQITKLLCYVYM
jgi:hypothetical protein